MFKVLYWRWLRVLVTLVPLATACSGNESAPPVSPPPPPPPPPPPAASVATTLAIHAGDAQSAAAGKAVAVAPAVIVRDQNGQPMSGVAVSFAIDSGGGSVQATNATTGTDGIASSGTWTLGLGRNKVKATSGTLAPVVFVATATGELTLADATIGAQGGELKVVRPGDPLDGLVVRVPAGAFGEPVTLSARYGDTTGVPAIDGFRAVSPPITLSLEGPDGLSSKPLEIEVNVALNSGEVPVMLLFDRLTGARDALMTVRVSGTRVVALTGHLDAAQLPSSALAGIRARARSGAVFPHIVQVILGVVTEEDLARDLDTGFRPGVDDWEFDHSLLTQQTASRHAPGLPLTAAYYFEHLKQARGPLNKRYQRAAGIEWSNPMGFRIGFQASGLVNVGALGAFNASLNALAIPLAGMSRDSLVLLHTKTQLFLTGRPQLVFAVDAVQAIVPPLALLVYRTRGSTLETTSGTSHAGTNAPKALTLVGGWFSAPGWSIKDPLGSAPDEVYQPDVIWAGGQNTGVQASALQQLWQQFDRGTVGAADFAQLDVATSDDPIAKDTIFIADDTTWVWIQCGSCAHGHTPGPKVTPTGKVQAGALYVEQNGAWTLKGAVRGNGVPATETDDGTRAGFLLAEVGADGRASYNSWQQFVLKTRRLTVTPSPLQGAGGATHTLTATYARPLPPSPTWQWDLGDGRVMTTQTNTLQVTYPGPTGGAADTFNIKVSLKSGSRLEATGRTKAIISPPDRWVFTSFTAGALTSTLRPGSSTPLSTWENSPTLAELELRDSLLARPGGGVLKLYAANAARPQPWRHPTDVANQFLLALLPQPNVETGWITYARGPVLMAGLVGATGTAVIAPGQLPIFNQPSFVNALSRTTAPAGFTGRGASLAYGTQTNFPSPSQVMRYLEIDAVTTATGLSGTITFVRVVQCWENHAVWGSCFAAGEVRRTFHFTAVAR